MLFVYISNPSSEPRFNLSYHILGEIERLQSGEPDPHTWTDRGKLTAPQTEVRAPTQVGEGPWGDVRDRVVEEEHLPSLDGDVPRNLSETRVRVPVLAVPVVVQAQRRADDQDEP